MKVIARSLLRLSLLLIVGAPLAGCSMLQASDKSIIQQAQGFDQGIKPAEIKDAQVNAYLQRIGDRIIAAAKQSDAAHWGPASHFNEKEPEDWMFTGVQWHLVNSKTLNAFTTGGQHVYIYNELFQLCHNEDELAAVMSHEFGHIYCRHVQKGTSRQYGALAAAALGAGAGYLYGGSEKGAQYASGGAALGMLAGNFAGMKFSRDDEAQADEVGFHFYCLAGWDPNHFGDFFQSMIEKGYDKGSEITSDHPSLASRLKIAQQRAKAMPDLPPAAQLSKPPIASAGQFKQYQQAAVASAKNTPDDTSLAQSQKLLAAIPRSCLTPVDPPDQKAAREELMRDIQQKQDQPAAGATTQPARKKRAAAQ